MRGGARHPALGLPAGADRLAARLADLPLLRHHHRLRRADLHRPSRPRRGGRLHRLAYGGRLRHRVPTRAAHRRGGGDGARGARGGVRAPRTRRQPGRRHAGCCGRDREVRVRELQVGRRVGGLTRAAAEARWLQPRSGFFLARARRQAAEPGLRLLPPRRDRRDLPAHRERAAVERSAARCSRCARTSARPPLPV